MFSLALSFIAALGLSLVLVRMCRAAAIRFGYTAKPREDRWHTRPTALLGGVGIAVTVLALHVTLNGARALPLLVVGTGLMFVLGLIDDLVALKPQAKLAGEIGIASLFVFFGYRLGWSNSLTLDTLLTVFWIVGLTNALNLLDNMDGLCAGVGLIAGAALLSGVLLTSGVTPESRYLVLLLGAIAGFLVYNHHPASIFMGDSGSLFIGLNLAVLTLSATTRGPANVLSIVVGPVLVLMVPIFDTALVTVSRVLSGRSIAQGGRDHSSHRLVAMGLSERHAVQVLWALAALGGLLSLSIAWRAAGWEPVAAAVFLIGMIIFAVYLSHIRVYTDADPALVRSDRITPFFVEFVYKRRVAEVLLDVGLVSIAYYSAYYVRFEGREFGANFPLFIESLPLVVGVQTLTLLAVGAYRGVWRYYSLMDGVTLTKGVALGVLTIVASIVVVYRFESYSRTVFMIYAVVLLLLLIGSRASFPLISEFAHRRRVQGRRLVIYGVGDGAVSSVRELLNQRGESAYRILGFIDDNPDMARTRMHGYPVLGDYASLTSLIVNGAVDAVVIRTGLKEVERMNGLQALCQQHGVALSRVRVEVSHIVAAS